MITRKRLVELLSYDPQTGVFTRAISIPGYVKGSTAGSPDKDGYICIQLDGQKYKAHRLAWLYMVGSMPIGRLDHKDTVRSNNRFENLREASPRMNAENKTVARLDNRLGVLGVSKKKNRFVAQIQVAGKKISIGSFSTVDEASDAYLKAKREFHKGCTL